MDQWAGGEVAAFLNVRAPALADPIRFMAYAMSYATLEDMKVSGDDDFREVLNCAPPGITDPRSWAYWNSKFGWFSPPPMPKRRFSKRERVDCSFLPAVLASRSKAYKSVSHLWRDRRRRRIYPV